MKIFNPFIIQILLALLLHLTACSQTNSNKSLQSNEKSETDFNSLIELVDFSSEIAVDWDLLYKPTLKLKFKNISQQNIQEPINLDVVWVNNTNESQFAEGSTTLSSYSMPFIKSVTKEISLVSDAGFRNKENLNVTAHVFINEEFFREFNIQNSLDKPESQQKFKSETERQQYYERMRQEESERQRREEAERQRKINEINSRASSDFEESNYGTKDEGNSSDDQKFNVSYSLSGRIAKSLRNPNYSGDEEGIVVVKVTVDRQGNVTDASPGARGTTIMNQGVWKYAKQAALKAKFDSNDNGPAFQEGMITYRFVVLQK